MLEKLKTFLSSTKGQVVGGNLLAVMVALIILLAAVIPVTIDTLDDAGLNGTARTVGLVIPTGLAIVGLILAFSVLQRRQGA